MKPWEWWLKLWENAGMPMEQLDWQLCELKKHCHSSANRKASKCNCSFLGTLPLFVSAPGRVWEACSTSLGERRALLPLAAVEYGQLKASQSSSGPRGRHGDPCCALWTPLPRTVTGCCVVYFCFYQHSLFLKDDCWPLGSCCADGHPCGWRRWGIELNEARVVFTPG